MYSPSTRIRFFAGLLCSTALAIAVAMSAAPTMASASTGFGPYATTASPSLNERSGPSTSASVVGSLAYNSTIYIGCQTQGSNVNGSTVWDQLTNGSFVSDDWVNTPVFDTWTPGIPQCSSQPAGHGPYLTTASPSLSERQSPSTSAPIVGSLSYQSSVYIICQAEGSVVAGSAIWDQLGNGAYVSDYWVSTPVFDNWTPGIPQCASSTGSDPRLVEAIAWDRAHAGSTSYNNLCELAVERAYGTSGRYASAATDYRAQLAAGHVAGGFAPAGALVFFKGDSAYGHVGIAAGGNSYYTSDGRIHLAPYSEGGVYLGWSLAPASWPGA
jgi:archaellum component FlaF (FlaF/FlaG flagellin family)